MLTPYRVKVLAEHGITSLELLSRQSPARLEIVSRFHFDIVKRIRSDQFPFNHHSC